MAKHAFVTGITGQDGSCLVRAKALSVGLSNAYFKSLGLPTLINGYQRNRLEPLRTGSIARWCGRGRRVTTAPMPIKYYSLNGGMI